MRPVRIFLMLRAAGGEWTSTAHRDLDEAIGLLDQLRAQSGWVGVMHVGLTRPVARDFDDICHDLADCLLFSTSARWAFHSIGEYSKRIGFVGDIGIHMAISGWGYDAAGTILSQTRDVVPRATGGDPAWLLHVRESYPDLARKVAAVGIFDDDSYRTRDEDLDWSVRRDLGVARMGFLMTGRDPDDPIDVVKACPPWLLNARMARVNMTVRCANSLRAGKVTFVRDLSYMTSNSLLKLPNLGRKSVRDLAQALWGAVKNGPIARETSGDRELPSDEFPHPQNEKNEQCGADFEDIASPVGISATQIACPDSFGRAFSAAMSSLSPNHVSVLRMRIGLGCRAKTLQEAGEEIGVTRERVRQLESKMILAFIAHPVWRMDFIPRLAALLGERQDPLPAESLDLFEPWFAGSATSLAELRFIIERVTDERFHMFSVNGCEVVTEIPKADWDKAIAHAANIMEQCVTERVRKSEVRRQVEDLLPYHGRELAGELWSIVQQGALFALDADGDERLVAMGTSGESLVAATLAASPTPVHYSELPKLIHAAFGRVIDVRRAHSAAGGVGILYGRGTYGTMRHCPLDADELALLRDAAEALVLGGSPERQWSCAEMLDLLGNAGLDFQERVNQYVLQIALTESCALTNLGRLVWKAKGEGGNRSTQRIDLSQAILSILEANGGPLTREEIRDILMRERGLSGYFQLNPRGSLIRLDARRWGLLERDVPLSSLQISQMRQFMADFLFHRQSGVHWSEIKTIFTLQEGLRSDVLDTQTIQSILATDHRFKTSMAGYIYLSSWTGPRRLTQGEAIAEVMKSAGAQGIRVADVMSKASALLGRQVERDSLYGAMVSAGAKYDDATGTWVVVDEEEVL
jgi:hypothetical protein